MNGDITVGQVIFPTDLFSPDVASAIVQMSIEQDVSVKAIIRRGIASYQLEERRRSEGETCTWSGDAQRAAEFSGNSAFDVKEPGGKIESAAREFLKAKFPDYHPTWNVSVDFDSITYCSGNHEKSGGCNDQPIHLTRLDDLFVVMPRTLSSESLVRLGRPGEQWTGTVHGRMSGWEDLVRREGTPLSGGKLGQFYNKIVDSLALVIEAIPNDEKLNFGASLVSFKEMAEFIRTLKLVEESPDSLG